MSLNRMHILYIAEFSTGGSIESLLCLVGGLDKDKFKATVLFYEEPVVATRKRFEAAGSTVLALYPRSTGNGTQRHLPKYNLQARIRQAFGQRIEGYYESLKYAVYFLRFRRAVFNAIRHQIQLLDPDVVHLNNGVGSDTPGIMAAHRCRTPAVCHVRTLGTFTHTNIIAARAVAIFLCISNAVRDQVVDQGIKPNRCIVVPNAVDPALFSEMNDMSSDIRAEYGWNNSHKLYALVGRVVSWKGQDVFIQAIADAYKTDSSIRGLIVGEGEASSGKDEYYADLQAQVSSLGLQDVVKFTGHRTDVPQIMQSADCVVCASSLPEPFGRVIIEGMAVGTPVIATDAGGARDIISNGLNGWLVPIKNSSALSTAITRLSGDNVLAERIRAEALTTVAEHYTVDQHVAQICTIYLSLHGRK